MTEHEFISWLKSHEQTIRTPAYIYSESILDASLAVLRDLFPGRVRVFYSLKANPQPAVVRHLSNAGVDAEIASAGEHFMCRAAGIPDERILVGGVAKSDEYLAAMCQRSPAGIVLDSEAEWERLRRVLSAERQARVLLRVNPGVSLGGLDMAGESQFGLDVAQAARIAGECSANPYAEFAGLHFYFGSQRLSAQPIVRMVELASEVLETFRSKGLRVSVVDLGLGCGVPYLERDATLDVEEVRRQLHRVWAMPMWASTELWTEAGRSLVAKAGFYVTRVIEKKVRHDRTFVFLDGGLHTHNPGIGVGRFFRSNPRFIFLPKDGARKDGAVESVELVGNLCTSADALGHKVSAPGLEEGDLVIIPSAGAYCQTTAMWGFNGQPLFSEAMLDKHGCLNWVEPQYKILLDQPLYRAG